eukprot:gene911-610_t
MTNSASNLSLVRYANPQAVTANASDKKAKKAQQTQPSECEDILNSILPPREWTENGQLWLQYVSAVPATRVDVTNLQGELDKQLQQRQARETGICPVREELYAQCFDEIIRQVTIICAERGLLLLRVRDEIRMTIYSYQSLYESSIAFGMRKALQAEQNRNQQMKRTKELRQELKSLEEQIEQLTKQILEVEEDEKARKEQEDRSHAEDVEKWKADINALKDQLETFLAAPSKKAAA